MGSTVEKLFSSRKSRATDTFIYKFSYCAEKDLKRLKDGNKDFPCFRGFPVNLRDKCSFLTHSSQSRVEES
jgi:hypothetical protein